MKWYLKCLKQYFDFSGRARRKEYWLFCLFNLIIAYILNVIDSAIGLTFPVGIVELGILSVIYSLLLFIPGLAVCVRRLHDIGKSGWFYLIGLIPLVGAIIVLIWFCKEGEHKTNKWGPDPKNIEN